MRPLTEEETTIFFQKLAKYMGRNIRFLIDRKDGNWCFRLHKDRVYYASEVMVRRAQGVPRDKLAAVGTCFGKFTRSKKFRLEITCLDYLARFAQYKIWIKPAGVMSYLYGNHVLKAHLGRITENTPKYQGVAFFSMNDVPLGFGVAAASTKECRKLQSTAIIAFHQADVGQYVREEDALTAYTS